MTWLFVDNEEVQFDWYTRIVFSTTVGCSGVVSGHVCAGACA